MNFHSLVKLISESVSVIVRPAGWKASNGIMDTWSKPGRLYRGMTSIEYRATVAQHKPIQSTGAYSHTSEGTCFDDYLPSAESYINYGRDDPRSTGVPTYIVEIDGHGILRDPRDGYYKSDVQVPYQSVLRVWEFSSDNDGDLVATQIK